MNDVRLHVPYIFGNKQNSKTDREETPQIQKKAQLKIEPREAVHVGQDKPERGKAKAR